MNETQLMRTLKECKDKMNTRANGNSTSPQLQGYVCSNCKADPMELTSVFGQVMQSSPDGTPGPTLVTCAVACKACRVLVTILPFQLIVPEKRIMLV